MGKRYLIGGTRVTASPTISQSSVNWRGEKKPLPNGFDPQQAIVIVSHSCGGSALAEDASPDIAFLRAWKVDRQKSSVVGRLYESRISSTRSHINLPQAAVTLEGPREQRHSITAVDGTFAFTGVAPGIYRVSFQRSGFISDKDFEPVIVTPGACGWVESSLRANGRLQMRVLHPGGRPAPHVRVETIPVDHGKPDLSASRSGVTDEKGILDVRWLVSGKYLVAVNPDGPTGKANPYPTSYYPGVAKAARARTIVIGPDTDLHSLSFTIPRPLPPRKVKVHIVDNRGNPVAGAHVFTKTTVGEMDVTELTDNRGEATLVLLRGVDYRLEGWKEFDTDGKEWPDFKRWRAITSLPAGARDSNVEMRFTKWRRNGDWR